MRHLTAMARNLPSKRVVKPWGRTRLWGGHPDAEGEPIGEIWFDDGADAELLVKLLFTSQPLSIQVHPNDVQAQARGFKRGKDEAWFVLDAEPDATIALGVREPVTKAELAASVRSGSVEALLAKRAINAGDLIYSPAGTVHALGGGIAVVEIQQNLDLTYRLYDYGSDRELHIEDGLEAANLQPHATSFKPLELSPSRTVLYEGGKFVVEQWRPTAPLRATLPPDLQTWFVALRGEGSISGQSWKTGEAWRLDSGDNVTASADGAILVAYPGGRHVTKLVSET